MKRILSVLSYTTEQKLIYPLFFNEKELYSSSDKASLLYIDA